MQQYFTAVRRAVRPSSRARTWLALIAAGTLNACGNDGPVSPAGAVSPTESVAADSDAGVNALGNRFAYLFLDQPSSSVGVPFTPNSLYSYNAKGRANSVTRTATGSYDVTLGGMAKGTTGTKTETFIVTPVGSARCIIGGWNDVGPDMLVTVRCVSLSVLANSPFTLLMVGKGSLPGRYAYAWAGQATAPSYTPSG